VTVVGDGTDGTPTGSFQVSDGAGGVCSGLLDGSGSGTCPIAENAAGTPYTVTASYGGDAVYAPADSAAISQAIGLATPNIVLTGATGTGDTVNYSVTVSGQGAIPTGTVSVTDTNSDNCQISLDSNGSGSCGFTEDPADGPFIVTAGYEGDGNYGPATGFPTPTVTVTDNSSSVAYGGDLTFTATVAGPGPAVTPTGSVSWNLSGPGSPACSDSSFSGGVAVCTVDDVAVGTYGATAIYGGDDNYVTGSGSDGSVGVGSAPLTITSSSPSFTYGGTPPAITVSNYAGFVNGDSASSLTTQASCSTVATSSSPVGSYASSCNGALDANYTITYTDGSVSVGAAALTVTASDVTTTYGTPPGVVAEYAGFVNGDSASSLTTKPSCLSNDTGSSPVGSYSSSCSGAVDANYTFSYVKGSVTVGPAPLTVTASSPSFAYGGKPPTITSSYGGLVNGDSASSLSPGPACTTTATSSSPAGSYTSSCSGAVDANYSFSYVNGTVTVDQATPTVTLSGQSGQSTGPVTMTVTVVGPTGAGAPTGSVTISDANASCSISSLDSGGGTCALVENASEDGQTVTASYAGDTNYTTAKGTTTENVSVASPNVAVSGPSSAITGIITYNVTVSGQGASPTGSVTISDGTKNGSGVLNSCTSPLNPQGVGSCSLQEQTGTYQVTADYTGNTDYGRATASASEVVNETATSLALSTNTLLYGLEQSATFSVTVTAPPGETPPTGTVVQLMAGTTTVCVTSPLAISYVTVIDPVLGPKSVPVATAACHLAPAAVQAGNYSVAALFPGEPGSFVGSTSTPASLTVQSAPTLTAVSISRAKVAYGSENSVIVTTKVSEPSVGATFVTGTVTVRNAGRILCRPTLEQGVATCVLTRTQLPAGNHNVVADYAGTTSLVPSASEPSTLDVAKAVTTSALSLSHSTARYGGEKSVQFAARVTVGTDLPPAGGQVVILSGSHRLCAINLVRGKGSCSLTASELSVGRHSISARYEGSSELAASVSRGQTMNVTKATTTQN
jgi:hypothetical protein